MLGRRRIAPPKYASVAGLLIMLGMLAFGTHVAAFLAAPPGGDGRPATFEIAEDEPLARVASRLADEGLIRNQSYFVIFGRLTGSERQLKPGEYALSPSMRPLEMLHRFRQGLVVLHPLTIPEGYSVRQIAAVLRETGLGDPDELLALAESPEFIRELGLDVASLEGYLFPDTYAFPRGVATADMVRHMVGKFRETYQSVWATRGAELGLTQHQVVTLASIIEKETGAGIERPIISAVFHNRLRLRMPLQSDPTVIYPIKNFDGNLRKVDLIRDNPYNTYRRRGLPPGPIASPGRHALEAALYPSPVDYLYFVARNDGTHHFSRTLREHNKAVDQYQRRGQRPRIKAASARGA
jgi:UPF0755 protein